MLVAVVPVALGPVGIWRRLLDRGALERADPDGRSPWRIRRCHGPV